MVPENYDNHDKDERLVTTEETIQVYFNDVLYAVNHELDITITPKQIAEFCEKNNLESPKLFAFHVLEIILETIKQKFKYPNVRGIRIPSWLDIKSEEIAELFPTADDLEKLLPQLPERLIKSDKYLKLSHEFLKGMI